MILKQSKQNLETLAINRAQSSLNDRFRLRQNVTITKPFVVASILYALCMIAAVVETNLKKRFQDPEILWFCFSLSMAGYPLAFLIGIKQFRATFKSLLKWRNAQKISSQNHDEPDEKNVDVKVFTVSTEGTKRLEALENMWDRAFNIQAK